MFAEYEQLEIEVTPTAVLLSQCKRGTYATTQVRIPAAQLAGVIESLRMAEHYQRSDAHIEGKGAGDA